MRVLCLLFLLPLGALASCPAGLKLSNVPIETALPFCVKWESSSLGGCYVACPGVCVEIPGAGTKGPIETTGSECKLGGGDGGGEGEGGGTGGDDVLPGFPSKNPVQVGGAYQEMTTLALSHINDTLRVGMTNLSEKGSSVAAYSHDLNMKMDELLNTAKASNNGLLGVEEATRQQTDLMWRTKDTLQQLTNCVVNPKGNNCEHLGGGGGSSSGDTAAIKSMMQTAMSWWSMNPNYLQSINNQASYMSGDLGAIKGMTEGMGSAQIKLQTQMAGDLAAIKGMIKDGQGSGGGSGGEGGPGIDYSQMPGSSQNPLHVAGADYESKLCQGDVKCAFDLGTINQRYEEQKEALKNQYKGIQAEISEMFKFHLGGSASAPKCFDMFSIFGKSYSICPDSGAYWETLAAIMMFIFYFIALMIVARR